MATINFTDKVALNDNPNVQDINKVKDSDMNLIKQVVNQIIKTLGLYTDNWISSGTYSIGDIVIDDNRYFKNITGANTTTEPKNDTTNWEETTIILNEKSSSLINTYCCDYINDLQTYSTTEQRVGTWIDGKPIYRKTYNVGNLPNANTLRVQSGLTASNINIVKLYGTAIKSVTHETFPLPFIWGTTSAIGKYIGLFFGGTDNNSDIWLRTMDDMSSYSGYVIVEYTKTTD